LDPVANFPETTEKPGFLVGFADNVGDILKFKVLKNDLSTVPHAGAVRSAADLTCRNKEVTIKSDVQVTLEKIDSISGVLIPSGYQLKLRWRNPNGEVSNRKRSKAGSIVDDRTTNLFIAQTFRAFSFHCMMQSSLKIRKRVIMLICS
jgi:hypothetical protein